MFNLNERTVQPRLLCSMWLIPRRKLVLLLWQNMLCAYGTNRPSYALLWPCRLLGSISKVLPWLNLSLLLLLESNLFWWTMQVSNPSRYPQRSPCSYFGYLHSSRSYSTHHNLVFVLQKEEKTANTAYGIIKQLILISLQNSKKNNLHKILLSISFN